MFCLSLSTQQSILDKFKASSSQYLSIFLGSTNFANVMNIRKLNRKFFLSFKWMNLTRFSDLLLRDITMECRLFIHLSYDILSMSISLITLLYAYLLQMIHFGLFFFNFFIFKACITKLLKNNKLLVLLICSDIDEEI